MRDLRTEIPDGWNEKKLNSVIKDLSAGISVNSGDRPADKNEIGVLKTSSLNKGRFIAAENKVISKEEEKERAKSTPKAGTILVSRMNTPDLVGEIAYVDKDYPNLYLPDRIWITEGINADEVNAKWLSYKLISPEVKHNLKSIATGTSGSMKNITQNDFLKLPVAFPPKHEQDQIVNIIEKWDEAISKTEKLIKAKKRYKKGLMQRLLSGKVRFPEIDGEDWIEVKLGEVFSERKDKGYGDLKLIAITTSEGVIDRDELDRRDTSSDDKSNYKRILPGDIGYNTMRMWQGVSGYSELEGIVSPAYTIVTPEKGKVDALFMSYLFKHPPVIDLFRRYSQGLVSDTLNLKYKNFAQIKLSIPPSIEEQRKIASVFTEVEKEIALLKDEVVLYQKQKKGLVQQLLTGKVRVS